MSDNQLYSILLTGLVGLVTSLVMGKTFRSLMFWPFSYLIRKLSHPTAAKVLDSLEKDAGIEDPIQQFADGKPLVNNTEDNTNGNK